MAATLPAMQSPPPGLAAPPAAVCGADAAVPENSSQGMWAFIEEQLEEELEQSHATMEHMELKVEREAAALRRRSGSAGKRLLATCGPQQRSLCYHFLHEMTRRSQSSLQCFFQAMNTFDDSLLAVPLERPPENRHVLTRAAAAWFVTAKSEGQTNQRMAMRLQIVTLCATQLSEGTGGPPILSDDIKREELGLLTAGLPDLQEPTMLQWIDLVRERFDVVSRGRAGTVFKATAPWMHTVAALAMHRSPMCEELPPRGIVVALAGLALLAAGLLRADTLLPAYMTDARWRDALDQVLLDPQVHLAGADPPMLEPRAAIAALEFATGVPIEEVRSYVPSVVMLAFGACSMQRQAQLSAANSAEVPV